jgi:hypothetical protein
VELLIRSGKEAKLYCEPEESEWPDAVKQREVSGYITALTWFRSQRVPRLYQAANDRAAGHIAVVDSYYDKLIYLYFDKPGLSWLMSDTDPYRPVYKNMIELDYHLLPEADCVVSFCVAQERWNELVRGRGRVLDRSSHILDTHRTQDAFLAASEQYCGEHGIPHIRFENTQSTTYAAATALREQLQLADVLK